MLGQFVAEALFQVAMEVGGATIRERFGGRGCVLAVVLVVGTIAAAIWLLS